jgi:hypothetical protein
MVMVLDLTAAQTHLGRRYPSQQSRKTFIEHMHARHSRNAEQRNFCPELDTWWCLLTFAEMEFSQAKPERDLPPVECHSRAHAVKLRRWMVRATVDRLPCYVSATST